MNLKELLLTYLSPGAEVVIGADASKDNLCLWVRDLRTPGKLKSYWEDVKELVECWCSESLECHELGKDLTPRERKTLTRGAKYHVMRLYADKEGVETLLSLKDTFKIQAIGMEPTGLAYTAIFAHICEAENIPIKWLGHIEVANYRRAHKLPNKNDLADAVAISDYLRCHLGSPEHFIEFAPHPVARIREIYLQLGSLARIQSPLANRRSQQLAKEFPEAAFKKSRQSSSDGLSPLLAFLTDTPRQTQRISNYYERLYARSIAPQYGVRISEFTRRLAQMNIDIHAWEAELEEELRPLLNRPEFFRYNQAFDELGMGLRTRAIVLAQAYPVEKFGRFNRLTGKFSYKKSEAAFKQRMGYGGEQFDSGDKEHRKSTGSKLTRKALYLYVLDKIAPQKARIDTESVRRLATFYDRRMAGFDYQVWVETRVRASRLKLLDDLHRKLQDSMNADAFKLVAAELARSRRESQLEEVDLSQIRDKPNLFESRKGYGSLTISHTAARAVKILFKLLTQES